MKTNGPPRAARESSRLVQRAVLTRATLRRATRQVLWTCGLERAAIGAARSTRARARYTLRRATAGVGIAVVLWYSLACARSSVVDIRYYSVTVREGQVNLVACLT